jgi:hypothetical protein
MNIRKIRVIETKGDGFLEARGNAVNKSEMVNLKVRGLGD